ncbi:hypothetical protein CSPAE12_11310 [Colletotrichum incanum]|nr:hypothetical protein CSPAE12_11310 [Colletotrichum incanum]
MAKLPELPIELLLTIASFLWSNQPAKKRLLDASTSRKHGALARTLHRERSSVIGFSSACKSLHEALKAEKYRFVSIHGHNSAQKLLSLLRLIRVRPEIGDHIQQLHLQLIPLACDTTSVSYEQLRSLKTWAETIGIVVEDATLLNALNYESGEDHEDSESCFPSTNQYEHDKTCLRILCSMLFYYLRDVKEITLSTSWELFSTLPDQLKSSRSDSQQSLWPRNFLPALQSLAFETNLPSVGESDCMNSCDIIGMAQIARGVSDVYLRGFGLHHNTGMAFSNKFLHSLVLQDVYLPSYRGGSVYAFLESCKNLSKFIYIRSDNIHQTYEYSIPSPLRIQEALKSSRKSLRTLCFYYGPTLRDHEIGRFFESFKNFLCLENLWVDAWSCGWAVEDNIESEVEMESESNFVEEAPTPASVTKLIQTLPPSLRRLHIDGPVDCVYDSLRWLALHCRDGMMPLLKEMAFDDLDSKIASEKLKIMFKEAGVKKCRVDTNLIMCVFGFGLRSLLFLLWLVTAKPKFGAAIKDLYLDVTLRLLQSFRPPLILWRMPAGPGEQAYNDTLGKDHNKYRGNKHHIVGYYGLEYNCSDANHAEENDADGRKKNHDNGQDDDGNDEKYNRYATAALRVW